MDHLPLILVTLFAACAAGTSYVYLLYPFVIEVLSRSFGSNPAAPVQSEEQLPRVSLLVAAHNEESVIEERIENALRLDYPRDRLEIVIASDGSTDRTAPIVRDYAARGVRLIHQPVRRGKAAVLCLAFEELHGEVVLMSDANTLTDPAAARALVRWFQDPSVGAVCGRLVLTDPVSGKNADSLYWRYETFLKIREARLGGLLGSNGAIYAIRKSAFVPIPSNTIVDDFVIPLVAKLRGGWRIIYDADAVAHEETAPSVAAEFRRRSRIGAGGWQAIALLWPLLNPRHGWVAFTFFSHKVLRWLCPFLMLGMLVCSAMLWHSPPFRAVFLIQVLFYLAAIVANWISAGVPLVRLFRVANMFVLMNAALFVGFFRWMCGPQDGTWKRTERSEPSQSPLVEV